jgi:4-amino-4-deoxy-L-arabinose transferase-like glycosyltransferase
MSSATPVGTNSLIAQQRSAWPRIWSSLFQPPASMVVVALALRLAYLLFGGLYRFQLIQWVDLEVANIGRSLALGKGFSSPWPGSIGPTAWVAPVYPWLVSIAFRLFGMFSHGAAFAMLSLNSVFSAFTCWSIYRTGRLLFSNTVALWAGWTWALFPYAIYWPIIWIWDTSLSAFLLSVLFMLTLEMEGETRWWFWLRYGLLWGIAALTNTAVLVWLPFSGCWLAYRLFRSGKRFLRPVVVGAISFWAVITPWLVRNYIVFDTFIFIRGDVGSEFRTGNNPLAKGNYVPSLRAGSNPALTVEYNRMGEVDWVAEQGHLAKKWITENPVTFLRLSCRRIFLFWLRPPERLPLAHLRALFMSLMVLPMAAIALMIRQRVHGAFLFATLLAFYPLTYYITFATPRYRHPIEPELVLLTAWLLWSMVELVKSRMRKSEIRSSA